MLPVSAYCTRVESYVVPARHRSARGRRVGAVAPLMEPQPEAISRNDGAHQHQPVTALQVKATELCHSYFTALGHLQNAAPEVPLDEAAPERAKRMAGYQGLVDELAAAVVQKHREIEGLIDELEVMPRSEEDELRRLREAQEEHAAATESLRASVAKTGAPRHARREMY